MHDGIVPVVDMWLYLFVVHETSFRCTPKIISMTAYPVPHARNSRVHKETQTFLAHETMRVCVRYSYFINNHTESSARTVYLSMKPLNSMQPNLTLPFSQNSSITDT